MTLTPVGPVAVDSSLLVSAAYIGSESVLDLELVNGAIYRYFAVPATIYQDLLAADSKGSYFNRHIRGRFHYVLIHNPK